MKQWKKLIIVVVWVLWPAAHSTSLTDRPVAPTSGQDLTTEPLAIVANRSNPVDGLSSSELRAVFLGGRSHWPNGRRVTLVMRDVDDPEREVILRDVCGMSEQQFKTHFVKGLYNGEILASPKILSSSSGVRRFVFNVPGAIGYLRLSEVDSTVKTLRIDENDPANKGYRLRAPVPEKN